ncbi:unnamed protein product, partial [Choristocarpus tenellus]
LRLDKSKEEEARREQLRAELHRYGALAKEPDLDTHCLSVQAVIRDKGLEDFLRKAGELKSELQGLVQKKCVSSCCLLRNIPVNQSQQLITYVIILRILGDQGKSSMRKNLMDTVERLRKALRNDVPSIL